MRKFLLPIINLVNLILISITWGLSVNTAVFNGDIASGNYYQLVWNAADHANVMGIVGFFLFIFAVALTLVVFLPLKARKVLCLIAGVSFIATGVLFTKTPVGCDQAFALGMKLSGSLITMSVLTFVTGALMILMAFIEFLKKEN